MAGVVQDIHIVGDYAYIAAARAGLRVLSVADPTNPHEVGSCGMSGYALSVHVAGGCAYVAAGYGGLWVISVDNPANPDEVDFYDTPDGAADVYVVGNYVYVATGAAGLFTLWFSPPVSVAIPTGGGALVSPADATTYTFPSGTFTNSVVITHTALYPDSLPSTGDLVGIDHAFEVIAVYSDTGQPAQPAAGKTYTVTVQYTDEEKGLAIKDTLALYYWDGGQWVREPTSVVDMGSNTVTATPDHFSHWAVLGETRRVYLPLVLKNYY